MYLILKIALHMQAQAVALATSIADVQQQMALDVSELKGRQNEIHQAEAAATARLIPETDTPSSQAAFDTHSV
jgi:hypothetical protein